MANHQIKGKIQINGKNMYRAESLQAQMDVSLEKSAGLNMVMDLSKIMADLPFLSNQINPVDNLQVHRDVSMATIVDLSTKRAAILNRKRT